MFLLCHSTYENVTHSYCARKSLEKSTLECTLDCDQRSNTGLHVRNSYARFRIGVVPMKSLCMHLEYPLMRQLSYFTPLRFVMLRGIPLVLVLRYAVRMIIMYIFGHLRACLGLRFLPRRRRRRIRNDDSGELVQRKSKVVSLN